MRNRAALGRCDANHATVKRWYESLYCSVVDTHSLGLGFPDLVVGVAGQTELVEVKTESGELLPSQTTFISTWRGKTPVIVRTQEDVTAHVQRVREWVSRHNWKGADWGREDPSE